MHSVQFPGACIDLRRACTCLIFALSFREERNLPKNVFQDDCVVFDNVLHELFQVFFVDILLNELTQNWAQLIPDVKLILVLTELQQIH